MVGGAGGAGAIIAEGMYLELLGPWPRKWLNQPPQLVRACCLRRRACPPPSQGGHALPAHVALGSHAVRACMCSGTHPPVAGESTPPRTTVAGNAGSRGSRRERCLPLHILTAALAMCWG